MPLQRISGAMVSDSTITGTDVQDGSLTASGTPTFDAGSANITWE